jgi:hypothetical protein
MVGVIPTMDTVTDTVMDMVTHIIAMDIITIHITMAYPIIEEDATQITIELKLVEDQTFQHETHHIVDQKQLAV